MLDPRVVTEILGILSQPPILVEVAVNLFFPDVAAEFQTWMRLQLRASPMSVYEWMQKKFPAAPAYADDLDPEYAFRELAKCIIREALQPSEEKSNILLG